MVAFLDELGVIAEPLQSPFALTRNDGLFEWKSSSPLGLFAPILNLRRPEIWTMLFDIIRFYYFAADSLTDGPGSQGSGESGADQTKESIGDYLTREGYSENFRDNCLVPMVAALWNGCGSMSPLKIPALSVICVIRKRNLFEFLGFRHQWSTIRGSARQITDAIMKDFPTDRLHLNTRVKAIEPSNAHGIDRVIVRTDTVFEEFDHVIIAVHGDEAREMLSTNRPDRESGFLSGYQTKKYIAILHSDLRVSYPKGYLETERPIFNPSSLPSKVSPVSGMDLTDHKFSSCQKIRAPGLLATTLLCLQPLILIPMPVLPTG